MAKELTQRTLVLIKPDAIARGLAAEIMGRFERAGLKIIGLKLVMATQKDLDRHFPKDREWIVGMGKKTIAFLKRKKINPALVYGSSDVYEVGKKILTLNYQYLTMGPVIAAVFTGFNVIETVRKLIGDTLPCDAPAGTIRGDFGFMSPDLAGKRGVACFNLVHGSSSPEEAEREIDAWFRQEELIEYEASELLAL